MNYLLKNSKRFVTNHNDRILGRKQQDFEQNAREFTLPSRVRI